MEGKGGTDMRFSGQLGLLISTLVLGAGVSARAQTVCLDPGHGGHDPGAVGCGLEEAAVNLDTALRLRDQLVAAGYSVLMTRETDVFVELVTRAEYANSNGADRFVAIHANSAGVVASGIETYCANNASAQSFDLRDRIQAEMVATWPLPDRGGKTANYTVLTATAMPATLSELGFINNCAVDATYLADGAERGRAAGAHLRAIMDHFGDEPVQVGVLRGVVFEDQGVGFDDMSVRLPGATVTLTPSGDSQVAGSPDGDWRFDLEPGAYTVRAEHPGHQRAQRTCDVVANQTTWCSLGMAPEEPADAGVDAGSDDGDAEVDASDAGGDVADGEPDAGADDGAPDGGLDAGTDSGGADEAGPDAGGGGGCGCSAAGAPAAGLTWLLFGLVLASAIGRGTAMRRVVGLVAMLALLAAPAAAGEPLRLEPRAPFARLVDEREVARGFVGPVLAPDGQRVVFSKPGYQGLWLAETSGGEPRQLSDRPRAGLRPIWRADSRAVGLRSRTRPYGLRRPALLDLDGRDRGPLPAGDVRAIQRDDRIWLSDGAAERAVSPAGVRAFAPSLSRDGRWLVYCSLGQGLFLQRLADGADFRLGPGVQPALSADGRWLVFARALDDGERVIGGDLWLVDLRPDTPRLAPLTSTPGRIELHPSLSAHGDWIAYWVDGLIALARVSHE